MFTANETGRELDEAWIQADVAASVMTSAELQAGVPVAEDAHFLAGDTLAVPATCCCCGSMAMTASVERSSTPRPDNAS